MSRTAEAFYLGSSGGDDRTIAASPPEGPEERRGRVRERYVPSRKTGPVMDPFTLTLKPRTCRCFEWLGTLASC